MESRALKHKSELSLFPSPISTSNSLSWERFKGWIPSQIERNISFWKLVLVNEGHTPEFSRRQKSHERQLQQERKEIKMQKSLKKPTVSVKMCEFH